MRASIGHDLVFSNDLIGTKQENIIHLKSKRTYYIPTACGRAALPPPKGKDMASPIFF